MWQNLTFFHDLKNKTLKIKKKNLTNLQWEHYIPQWKTKSFIPQDQEQDKDNHSYYFYIILYL